jgi:murein DD-endopeptidase MepM/ murein hydrolase activator NlpD
MTPSIRITISDRRTEDIFNLPADEVGQPGLLASNRFPSYLWLFTLLLLLGGCSSGTNSKVTSPNTTTPRITINTFDGYIDSEFAVADGFDFPVGDPDGKGAYTDAATGQHHSGWYIATHFAEEYSMGIHTGEDWNGAGGGNTDMGQPVYAVAHGRVSFAQNCGRLWGNVVIIDHVFYDNHNKRLVRSLYAHLHEIKVREGDEVRRRQLIATIGQDPDKLFNAHLHLEFRWDDSLPPTYWPSSDGKDQRWVKQHYAAPTEFIKSRRTLPVPSLEPALLLVDQSNYKMRLYQKGKLQGEYDVSFGQSKASKRVEGDNGTPKGMYFVIEKHRGEIAGTYGRYYGGYWIKINYPNRFDAARGRLEGIITPQQEAKISASWERRAPTLENTKLGGGIGFHGWIREWSNDGPRHLSWGCVVLHLYDIDRLFDQIPRGTMVIIF